jgi:hypothetical protein
VLREKLPPTSTLLNLNVEFSRDLMVAICCCASSTSAVVGWIRAINFWKQFATFIWSNRSLVFASLLELGAVLVNVALRVLL